MKKLLFGLSLIFCALSNAQVNVTDTLWSEGFESGTYDPLIFKSSGDVLNYPHSVQTKPSSSLGESGKALVLQLGSYYGDLYFDVNKSYSGTVVYDSIIVYGRMWNDYLLYYPNEMSYQACSQSGSIPCRTYSSTVQSGSYSSSVASIQTICKNCTGFNQVTSLYCKANSTYSGNPYDKASFLDFKIDGSSGYSQTQYLDFNKLYTLSSNLQSAQYHLTNDFCIAAATEYKDFAEQMTGYADPYVYDAVYNDCSYNNRPTGIPAGVSELYFNYALSSVTFFGYRQGAATSISDLSSEVAEPAYPNPAKTVVNVSEKVSGIYSLSGTLIQVETNGLLTINVEGLSSGIYSIQYESGKTEKLVISK